MNNVVEYDIEAARHVPFAEAWHFEGIDLTGHALAMQVRLTPDTPGAPLVSLGSTNTQYSLGLRLRDVTGLGWAVESVVEAYIPKAIVEALPAANELGGDRVLAWDMTITPPGGVEQRTHFGKFTVVAGVKQ